MNALTPRVAALRVAVLSCLLDQVKAEHAQARKAAEEVFAPVRKDGQTQQKVLLPDGTEIGLISIRGGSPAVDWGEPGALLAWCRDNAPHHVEQYVVEGAFEMNDVIEVVAAFFPNLVKERIRASSLAAMAKQVQETGGYVIDDESGEKHKLAAVTTGDPTGVFAYRAAKGAQDRIVAEWMAGNLREIALGPLALPEPESAAEPEPDEPEMDLTSHLRPPFGDEHGFLNPEMAAAHAVVVQGGFTTPPIEAYRMLRDSDGVSRVRADRWIREHGLDYFDPDEGKNTPWPLPAPGGDTDG